MGAGYGPSGGHLHRPEVDVKNNIEILLRERGKIVARRESHNIWTQPGKTWLGRVMSYTYWDPDVWMENHRLRYMSFGIGGIRQGDAQAFIPPLSVDYPGDNLQTNRDDRVTTLERQVLFTPISYYKQFDAVSLMSPYHIRFTVEIGVNDINLTGTYLSVPLSEVALHNSLLTTSTPGADAMGYDVFDTLPKSSLQDMTVYWTVRL